MSFAMTKSPATGALVLSDGTVFFGCGFGAPGMAVGEVCFNTAMTGYQEILTDPSYAGQIITFTFPHIGNVGANGEDVETASPAAASGVRGCVMRQAATKAASYRAQTSLNAWLTNRHVIGLAGIDTRALTRAIRETGMPGGVILHDPEGTPDLDAARAKAKDWPGLVGKDLAGEVTCKQSYTSDETCWAWPRGFGKARASARRVVVVDYGVKKNILRCLSQAGCALTVVPARTSAEEILGLKPAGVFLSNGPGDPAATGVYAVPSSKTSCRAACPYSEFALAIRS